MFERILVPLDGSEVAGKALPYGEELAARLGSELVLYHVHEPEHEQLNHMHRVYLDRLAETAYGNIKQLQTQGAEVKVTTSVGGGEPTRNIRNLVNKNKIDLIIMTAVSASGLKVGKTLGSVTDQVCRTSPIPVMLIRPQNVRRTDAKGRLINHILMTMDGSELSKLALPVGEEVAHRLKVGATLFQMANRIILYGDWTGGNADIYYENRNEDEKKRVNDEMTKIETELKQRGLNVTHIVTAGFDAADEIINVSKKISVDLVIMSSHGQSGLRRWWLGSVAEKVLRYGETPLLLVHVKAG